MGEPPPRQGRPGAIDEELLRERLDTNTRTQQHHVGEFDELPDGVFVFREGEPYLVLGAELLGGPLRATGRTPRPTGGPAEVVTPPSLVAVLRSEWRSVVPLLHASASPPRLSARPREA